MAKQWDPIDEILKIHKSINENLSRAFKSYRKPHSHISHSSKLVVVEIKLPGINKKDVKLHIDPKSIIIKTEKKEDNTYFRKILLSPGLDVKKCKIRFYNSKLLIKIPKKK